MRKFIHKTRSRHIGHCDVVVSPSRSQMCKNVRILDAKIQCPQILDGEQETFQLFPRLFLNLFVRKLHHLSQNSAISTSLLALTHLRKDATVRVKTSTACTAFSFSPLDFCPVSNFCDFQIPRMLNAHNSARGLNGLTI